MWFEGMLGGGGRLDTNINQLHLLLVVHVVDCEASLVDEVVQGRVLLDQQLF